MPLFATAVEGNNTAMPAAVTASRRAILLGSAATLAAPSIARAQASRFRFNLGWRVEASAAGYLLAAERGYYREEGLDVTIDTGSGSAGAITQVAGGAYDGASADLASLIQHNLNNPGRRLIAAAIQYDKNPNALIVKADGPIRTPRDFVGKRIAGQPFNASRALFPIFARAQGIPADSVQWQSVDPGLGNQLFVRGEVDAVAFFFFTGLINLQAAGLRQDQMRSFVYADYGLRGYGNGIVVNPALMSSNPRALAGFVRASTRGWIDCIADPDAGGRAVKAREGLADQALETARLRMITEGSMVTPDTRANGWGTATPERLAATIEETLTAFNLQGSLTQADIFTDRFLAPAADRAIRAPGG
jgi:NitT/TauT family transport system substrate-binding protein